MRLRCLSCSHEFLLTEERRHCSCNASWGYIDSDGEGKVFGEGFLDAPASKVPLDSPYSSLRGLTIVVPSDLPLKCPADTKDVVGRRVTGDVQFVLDLFHDVFVEVLRKEVEVKLVEFSGEESWICEFDKKKWPVLFLNYRKLSREWFEKRVHRGVLFVLLDVLSYLVSLENKEIPYEHVYKEMAAMLVFLALDCNEIFDYW